MQHKPVLLIRRLAPPPSPLGKALYVHCAKLGFSGELKSSFVSNYSSVAYGATFPHKGRLIMSIAMKIDGKLHKVVELDLFTSLSARFTSM